MSLFRIAVAVGVLFAVAPEQSLKVARAAFGMAEEVRQLPGAASEQAMAYCKENPAKCMEMAKQVSETAETVQGKPTRSRRILIE